MEGCKRMLVTFPHMGNAYIAMKSVLEDLGVEVLVPPPCTKRTLEIGTKHSPELACLPLKLNIGNYIESIEKGAEVIAMAGGCGPCRFGYYAEVQREILTDLGYKFQMVVMERPQGDVGDFLNKMSMITGGKSVLQVLASIKRATRVAVLMDQLEKLCWQVRPREKAAGTVSRLMREFHYEAVNTKGSKDLSALIGKYKKRISSVEIEKEKEILRIGIVGEIYTVIEPFVNVSISEKLGDLGAEVDKSITVSYWVINHLIKEALHLYNKRELKKASHPYLRSFVGGHGQESVANTVLYRQRGYDGVIHLLPFACMPEIVARSVLPTVSHDVGIPVMTLVLDEMTGEAGYMTRLEAFIDLIRRKKEMKEPYGKTILPGN